MYKKLMSAPWCRQTAPLANRLLASVFLFSLLLGLGPNVEAVAIELSRRPVGHEGWTALMDAASRGDAATVQDLLAKQVDVNAKDLGGYTALMAAAYGGNLAIVQALLAKGADVNAKFVGGETALGSAVGEGHTAIVQLLLNKGAEIGPSLLRDAVLRGRAAIVEALLDRGADPNAKTSFGDTTLLVEAVRNGHMAITKALLAKGADIHARDRNGKSPLLLAVEAGRVPLVGALLDKGVDPNMKDSSGDTALILAAGKGHAAIVQMLLGKGADVRAKNTKGLSALSAAAEAGSVPILTNLLEKGADINDRDESGRTALLHATKGPNELVVASLLGRGAVVTAHDLELLLNEGRGWKVGTSRALLQRASGVHKETWTTIASTLLYFEEDSKVCNLKRWDPRTQSSTFLLSVPECTNQVVLNDAGDRIILVIGKMIHEIVLKPTPNLRLSIQLPFVGSVEADGPLRNIFQGATYLTNGRLAVTYEHRTPHQGDAMTGNPTTRSIYAFENGTWTLVEEKSCDGDEPACFSTPIRGIWAWELGRRHALWNARLAFNPFVVARGLAGWDDKKFILDKRVEDVMHTELQPQWEYVKFNINGKPSLVIYDAGPDEYSSDLSTYRIFLQTADRRPAKVAEHQSATWIEGKHMLLWEYNRAPRLIDLETGQEPLEGLKFAFWIQ